MAAGMESFAEDGGSVAGVDDDEWTADQSVLDARARQQLALDLQAAERKRAEEQQRPSAKELQDEADKRGYGGLYAVFGGGQEGLEACAASESLECGRAGRASPDGYHLALGASRLQRAKQSLPALQFRDLRFYCSPCSGRAVRAECDRHAAQQLHPAAARG